MEEKASIEANFTNNTLEKRLFAATTFTGARVILFQSKKTYVYFGIHESFLHSQKREEQINTV